MSKSHIPPNLKPEVPFSLLTGLFLALVVMLLLPISQYITSMTNDDKQKVDQVDWTPPQMDDVQPPPPEEEPEPEIEETEQEMEPPSIEQLELSMNTDVSGLAGGDFTMPSFDLGQQMSDIIYELSDLTEAPRPVGRPNIQYPLELKSQRVTGSVTVRMVVRADGSVGEIRVEKSDHPLFEEAVIRAMRRMRFEPGQKDGKAVNVWVRQTFPFKII
ncbi:MAG: periplasmic protein TonB [Puniceicoccaceae bacterium 5H]|nr:MAG: periplasmic protein TonB [Puniceicoccaceae bacterium 5H]